MIVVGIDPGRTIGLCAYDSDEKRVVRCLSTQDPVEALYWVEEFSISDPIGIERVEGLACLKHHVVGDVDDQAHRAHPRSEESL